MLQDPSLRPVRQLLRDELAFDAIEEVVWQGVAGLGRPLLGGDPRGSKFGEWVTERGPALCGTFGCMLPNNHPGLHKLPQESGKRSRSRSSKQAQARGCQRNQSHRSRTSQCRR